MARLRTFKLPNQLFASSSAWNQPADHIAVIEGNEKYVAKTFEILDEIGAGGIWINHVQFTFPIFRTKDLEIRDREVRSYEGDQWPPLTIPWYRNSAGQIIARGIPLSDGPVRASEPQGANSATDGALILYNPDTCEEYDFWQATTFEAQGGGVEGDAILKAGGISWFHVDESAPGSQLPVSDANFVGTLPRGSGRATGVPYLAGLLVPEDFERGVVSHALAFVLPRLRHTICAQLGDPPDYVYPATNTETKNFTREPFSLAAGMRIRLREQIVDKTGATIDESELNTDLAPVTRMFFRALREYGAYLVDGGGGFAFGAEDQWTANLNLSLEELSDLVLLDVPTITELLEKDCKTKWQILMEKLNDQLSWQLGANGPSAIPFAASTTTGNFDIVENATVPNVNWLRRVDHVGFADC
jgi:hypothetical protein